MDRRGVCTNEGRTGGELDVVSMEDDVLKVSVTGVKSAGGTVRGYSSPCVSEINPEHGRQGCYHCSHNGDVRVPLTWG